MWNAGGDGNSDVTANWIGWVGPVYPDGDDDTATIYANVTVNFNISNTIGQITLSSVSTLQLSQNLTISEGVKSAVDF